MRAYSVRRPIDIGTWPREYEVSEIVRYDRYTWVEEIKRYAYGYLEFVDDVPRDALEHFDLVTPPVVDELLARIVVQLMRYTYDERRFDSIWRKAVEMGYDPEVLADAYQRATR